MKLEKKGLDFNENEKAIFEIIKMQKTMELSDLKAQVGLSNKGWDKAVKELTRYGLVRVTKNEGQLIIEYIKR